MRGLDRRSFLKLATAGIVSPFGLASEDAGDLPVLPKTLGRITQYTLPIYKEPDGESEILGRLRRDMVVPIYEETDTVGLAEHNSRWFRIRTGWLYSSHVQPVQDAPQRQVVSATSETGFWGEVSVPFTDARREPSLDARFTYRMYYSSVHRVVGVRRDRRRRWWYEIADDYFGAFRHYMRAEHLRAIPPAAMTPISTDVEDKEILVDLGDQRVYAFEDGVEVYSTRCATGAAFSIEELGGLVYFGTPTGTHSVVRKRPSRHMVGGVGRSDYYDLPGVPFCTYFTEPGAAIHGAYWHNDFGHPRSHGCVNVLPEAARWFYRWSNPIAPYGEPLVLVEEDGTTIVVS